MGLLIAGIVVLIIAAIVHSYCAVGIKCSAVHRPMFFDDVHPSIPHIIWIVPFATGISLLFIYNWIVGLVGLFVYWLIMPLLITPIMRKWMLPSWDELPEESKASLRRMGYDKNNYLEGDWWKRDEYKSRR
jgi:hypothetical protein